MLSSLFIHDVPIECINKAAVAYHIPATVIISVLEVENGRVGLAKPNSNGTYDYGPMQVNSIWLPKLGQFAIDERQLRDDPCTNVSVGAWILGQKITQAESLWPGIANYHSMTTEYNLHYQKKVADAYWKIMHYLHKTDAEVTE